MTIKTQQITLDAISLRLNGYSVKQIADTLRIPKRTVEARFDKLRVEYNAKDIVHLIGILYNIQEPLKLSVTITKKLSC